MEPVLWQRSIKLLDQTRGMPVQARGRTKKSTNLHVQPGRTEPRLYQFGRNAPVEIVGRAVADWVQVTDEKTHPMSPKKRRRRTGLWSAALATRPPGEDSGRAAEVSNTTQPGDQTVPIAGWVVPRFVEMDLPEPVREGAPPQISVRWRGSTESRERPFGRQVPVSFGRYARPGRPGV